MAHQPKHTRGQSGTTETLSPPGGRVQGQTAAELPVVQSVGFRSATEALVPGLAQQALSVSRWLRPHPHLFPLPTFHSSKPGWNPLKGLLIHPKISVLLLGQPGPSHSQD